MHLFECEATFEAEPAEVWKVWTDVERWPEWDVSKEIAQLDGPFQPGVSGWAKQRGNLGGSFTITAVDDGRRWVTECPIPLGKVVFDHLLEPAAEGHVRVVKKVEVHGGFGSLLRLIAPKMRRDITQSLAALERQLSALGTRRHGHQAHGFGPSQSAERHVLRALVDVCQGSFSRQLGGYVRPLARAVAPVYRRRQGGPVALIPAHHGLVSLVPGTRAGTGPSLSRHPVLHVLRFFQLQHRRDG